MAIQFTPLHPLIGAETHGIDLRAPIAESEGATLREALRRFRLLLVRDQHEVSVDHQIAFTRVFGELYVSRSYKGEMGDQGYYFSNTRAMPGCPSTTMSPGRCGVPRWAEARRLRRVPEPMMEMQRCL